MEKSPYDASAEDAFYRNQKRLKEELAEYTKHIEVLDKLLKQVDSSMDEVRAIPLEEVQSKAGAEGRASPMDEFKNAAMAKKPKRVSQKNWLRI